MGKNKKLLIVFFEQEIELAWITADGILRDFEYKNDTYFASGENDFNGFYDWLTKTEGAVIGVRFFGFENYYYLVERLKKLAYVIVENALDGDPILNIYFSEGRNVDEASSGDQEFGDNWLFETTSGKLAMSFYADYLPDKLIEGPIIKIDN